MTLWVVIVVLALLAGISAVVYQLFARYGRILLRLEALERGTNPAESHPAASHLPDVAFDERTLGALLPGRSPLLNSRIERDGIKPGTHAPDFDLPDLDGRPVSLAQYQDRRVLLVFSDPDCSPCDQVTQALGRFHREHMNGALALIMVGRGDPEANRRKAEEYRVGFPIVLQRKWELSRKYGIFATPVGFLIGADGLIETPMATGVHEILALAREASAPVKQETASEQPI